MKPQDLFKPRNGCKIGIKTKSFHKLVKSELTNCNPFYLSEGDLETVYKFNFIKGRLQSIKINISPDYDKFENNIEGKIDYNIFFVYLFAQKSKSFLAQSLLLSRTELTCWHCHSTSEKCT